MVCFPFLSEMFLHPIYFITLFVLGVFVNVNGTNIKKINAWILGYINKTINIKKFVKQFLDYTADTRVDCEI